MKIHRRSHGLSFGETYEAIHDLRGRVEIYWEPRDFWIGAYVAESGTLYLCPLPMLAIRFSRGRAL
jgi:hypothetical protein